VTELGDTTQVVASQDIYSRKRFFEQRTAIGGGHELEVMLKLNSKQYGSGLVGYLSMLWVEAEGSPVKGNANIVLEQAALVSKLFQDFKQHRESAHGNELYDFAWVRLAKLKLELQDAGLNPHDSDALKQRFGDDPDCVGEYDLLLKEAIWQFNALVLDISRHWSEEERPQNENHAGWITWSHCWTSTDGNVRTLIASGCYTHCGYGACSEHVSGKSARRLK
jgi:hypothetical protein